MSGEKPSWEEMLKEKNDMSATFGGCVKVIEIGDVKEIVKKAQEEEREKWKKEANKWIRITEILALINKSLEMKLKKYQKLVNNLNRGDLVEGYGK